MRTTAWLLAAAALLALGRGAEAATIPVTSGNNAGAGTLRDAIANANAGDTIQIANGVTVRLEGDLTIPAGKGNLTIEGPPPNGAKQQATIAQAVPAPTPPAHVVVDAPGVTIRQIGFDGVRVDVHGNGATIHTCDFDGKGKTDGVDVSGATGASVGTANQANTFKNCIVAVAVKDSTDTTVTNNLITKSGVGVTSQDDKNVTVSGNSIKDGDGVIASGSSGTVSTNKLTPDKKGGVAVDVGPGAGAGGTQGPMSVQGNDVKAKGTAIGVQVHGRTDVTVSSNAIQGKTKGDGVSLGCDHDVAGACLPWATTTDPFVCADNTIAACGTGVRCDLTGATQATCTIRDNVVDHCSTAGFACTTGQDADCLLVDNRADACGIGMDIACEGASTCGVTGGDVSKPRRAAVRLTGPVICSFESVALQLVATPGFHLGEGAHAVVRNMTLPRNGAFLESGAGLAVPDDQVRADAFKADAAKPQIDCAPKGWGTEGLDFTVAADGRLTVNPPPGAVSIEVRTVTGAFVSQAGSPNVFDLGSSPGTFSVVVLGDAPFPFQYVVAEAKVKWKGVTQSGGGSGLDFSKVKAVFTAPVGQEADTQTIVVSNPTGAPIVITIDRSAIGPQFFAFPSGEVTVFDHANVQIVIGFSATQPGTYHKALKILVGGNLVKSIALTGTAQ
jgi:hypothetical protein